MLVIRLQRTGRKGHAMFRVVVQDSRRTPTSGKVVAHIGNYDPHNKTFNLDKEKAQHFLDHGAQPSERLAVLLKSNGVKLPKWVILPAKKTKATRSPEKRKSTRPEEPKEEVSVEPPKEVAAESEEVEKAEPESEEVAPTEAVEVTEEPKEKAKDTDEKPTQEEKTDEEKSN